MNNFAILKLLLFIAALSNANARDDNVKLPPSKPQQIHLSLGKSHSEMVVTWTTYAPTISRVNFGENEFTLELTKNGDITEFVDNGHRTHYIHRVLLEQLKPNTKYYYKCGSYSIMSDLISFKTLSDDTNWSPKMLVYGDLGLKQGDHTIPYMFEEVANGNVDVIFHNGDIAYDLCSNQSQRGDAFMQTMEQMISKIAFETSPGNHETGKFACLANYIQRFSMHDMTSPSMKSKSDHYYAFYLGPALIISINNEVYIPKYSKILPTTLKADQEAWLVSLLKEANKPQNRARHPWIVVIGHQPMYCHSAPNEKCCTKEADLIRENLEDILYEYGVDVVIGSHIHNYEKQLPVYKSKVCIDSIEEPYKNPKAPVHIITGSAGCWEKLDFQYFPRPAWNAFGNSQFGYGILQIVNSTNLVFNQSAIIESVAKNYKKLQVIDSVEIIQEVHGSRNMIN